jgi:hypothetical protein
MIFRVADQVAPPPLSPRAATSGEPMFGGSEPPGQRRPGLADCRGARYTFLDEPVGRSPAVVLNRVTLRNFKCFEQLELAPGRITVLIGENGTGKSSVLQALGFLRQSAPPQYQQNRPFAFDGALVNLVDFDEVVWPGPRPAPEHWLQRLPLT